MTPLNRVHLFTFISLISLLLPFPLYGGLEGRLEALMEADNRYNKDLSRIEGWGDILIREKGQAHRYGLTLSGSYEEEAWCGEIYQLYAERDFGALSLLIKGGRFERSDQSGYYGIDGVFLKKERGPLSFSLYGGRLLRVEEHEQLKAGTTGGMEITFADQKEGSQSPLLSNLHAQLGYIRIDDDSKLSKLVWGLGKASGSDMKETGFIEFQTGGVYLLEEGIIETTNTALGIKASPKTFLRLAYTLYEPGDDELSLRDRFYSLYAEGKEEAISGEIYFFPVKSLDLYLTGKEVNHEKGQKGYHTVAGAKFRTKGRLDLNLEADYLYLDEEKAHTIYLTSSSALDSKTTMNLGALYQILDKRTTGENRGFGLDVAMERMIDGDLFLSLYGMNIINSDGNDEYRVGTRLTLIFSGEKQ